jgi:aryl-alcohol dehydrogenase-like predicted oxidoreductase
VASLRPVADEAGCTMSQLALAWLLRQDTVSSVIVGATKVEHVDDNAAAGDLHLPREVIDRVGEGLAPFSVT